MGSTKRKKERSVMKEVNALFVSVAMLMFSPAAFGEDGYIESEGDAFVNLGHCAGPNTKIAVDLQMTELKFNTYPFGSYGGSRATSSNATNTFELYISHGGDEVPRFSFEYSSGYNRCAHNCNHASLERYILSFDAQSQTYSSTNLTSGGALSTHSFADKPRMTETSTYPMSLFGGCTRKWAAQSGHFTGASKMKVYGVKIYESGTLVKDFVPCLASGIPGLRDVINNTFVTGIDSTKVKYGGDIMEKDDGHIDIGDKLSDGTAGQSIYLYPSYQFGPQTRMELDFALLTNSLSTSPFLFSAYNGSKKNMEIWSNGGYYAFTINGEQIYGTSKIGDFQYVPVGSTVGVRRTFSMNSNSVAIITAGYTNAVKTVAAADALTTTLDNMTIALRGYYGTRYLPLRVYGFRLYESDVLVRNYVPLVTNGVPAMINTVNGGVLYPLVKGGNGTKRALVAEAGGVFDEHTAVAEGDAYLQFPGNVSLDTGYRVTPNSCIDADFSLWDTYVIANGNEELIYQGSGTYVRFAAATDNNFWWRYYDYPTGENPTTIGSSVNVSNERHQYKFDSYNGRVVFKSGDEVLYDVAMTDTRTRTDGSESNLKIGYSNARMRLYGLKISESGTEVRNYVPCVTNGVAGLFEKYTKTFFPLTGGKVSGKTAANEDEFVTVPQPARLTRTGTGSTTTLACFAPSAQSYAWYEDGVRMPGETSDSLTLNWERPKAKAGNNVHTYSVKPVYTVFNEKVPGEAVIATVEYMPLGSTIFMR